MEKRGIIKRNKRLNYKKLIYKLIGFIIPVFYQYNSLGSVNIYAILKHKSRSQKLITNISIKRRSTLD